MKIQPLRVVVLALSGCAIGADISKASADNLLNNGGFETGNALSGYAAPPPWYPANGGTPDTYDNTGVDGWGLGGIPQYEGTMSGVHAHSGSRFLTIGASFQWEAIEFEEAVTQTVPALIPGASYVVSAWMVTDDRGLCENFGGPFSGYGWIEIFVNGAPVAYLESNTTGCTWQKRSFVFVAPNDGSTSATFEFRCKVPVDGKSTYIGLDDVSVSVLRPWIEIDPVQFIAAPLLDPVDETPRALR